MADTTTDDSPRVTVTVTDGIADVRLNRPAKRNALDLAMFAALVSTGERLKTMPGLRAVVLSGEGQDFCAGWTSACSRPCGRVPTGCSRGAEVPPPRTGPRRPSRSAPPYVWAEQPVPVIAAIRGNALGGGLQIALGADIRIVAPDARLRSSRWPGADPRHDRHSAAARAGRPGRGQGADLHRADRQRRGGRAIGLATRTDPDPLAAALAMAREIAGRSPHAIRAAKRLLDLAGRPTWPRACARAGGDPRPDRQPEPAGGHHGPLREARAEVHGPVAMNRTNPPGVASKPARLPG